MPDTTTKTPAQMAELIQLMIISDVQAGWMPATVTSFGELHEHCDANVEYLLAVIPDPDVACTCDKNRDLIPDHTAKCDTVAVGAEEWAAWMALGNQVSDLVHAWLQAGHLGGQPVGPLCYGCDHGSCSEIFYGMPAKPRICVACDGPARPGYYTCTACQGLR